MAAENTTVEDTSTEDHKDPGRAQARIQGLTREVAALRGQLTQMTNQRDALAGQIEKITGERETARAELKDIQSTHGQQLAAARAGITGEADMKAAQALHAIYGEGKPFAEWIAQPRDKLPQVAQALLPAPASTTATTTKDSKVEDKGKEADPKGKDGQQTAPPPRDPGGTEPPPARKFSAEEIKEIAKGGKLFKDLVKEHGSVEAALAAVERGSSAA